MTSAPDKSRSFYGDLFGWTSEEAGPEYGGYINFSMDGVQIAGGMPNDGQSGAPDGWFIYLATDDAETTAKMTEANGGQVLVAPMAVMDLGSMAVLVDAGGAAIGAWQPGTHKGFGVIDEPGAPSWFELFTRDYDASVSFYRDVFRWDTTTVGDTPDFRYTTLGKEEAALAGIMDATGFLPEGVPAHWSIYFHTTDADASLARIVELGGAIVAPAESTPYGRMATVADPTGTTFKLRQPPS
jgi:hypothetical protein